MFENRQNETVVVNGRTYQEMLSGSCSALIMQMKHGYSQKMVTSHSTSISMDMLWTTFIGQLISWVGDTVVLHSLVTYQSLTYWMLVFKMHQTSREELKTLQKTFLLFQGKSCRRQFATYILWWTNVLLMKVIWQALFLKYRIFVYLYWIVKASWIFFSSCLVSWWFSSNRRWPYQWTNGLHVQ